MSTVALGSLLIQVSEAAFNDLCCTNPDLRLERTTEGALIVMPPTGGETGDRNDEISYQLRAWNKRTGFWMGRFQTCPDSPDLQEKMQEYRENGVRLGWLINPEDAPGSWQVEIHRAKQEKSVLQSPTRLSGEDVLPGFVLNLSQVTEL